MTDWIAATIVRINNERAATRRYKDAVRAQLQALWLRLMKGLDAAVREFNGDASIGNVVRVSMPEATDFSAKVTSRGSTFELNVAVDPDPDGMAPPITYSYTGGLKGTVGLFVDTEGDLCFLVPTEDDPTEEEPISEDGLVRKLLEPVFSAVH